MRYYFGIDGGGTKTECVVGDQTSVLARASAGTCKVSRAGEPAAREALLACVRDAALKAQVPLSGFVRGFVGLAGGSNPATVEWVRAVLATLVSCPLDVTGDHVIAQHDAFGGRPGVLVISGTGSIAFGRNAAGQSSRAGGWGSVISDQGSAHWIGRKAVAAIMRAYDAGDSTTLFPLVQHAWSLQTHEEIVARANAQPAPNFAALAPGVVACALAGDAFASRVVEQAGEELAGIAARVLRRLWQSGDSVEVAAHGGVFRNASPVRQSFEAALHAYWPQAQVLAKAIDAGAGALALARAGAQASAAPR